MNRLLLFFCFATSIYLSTCAQSVDADRLGKAISYFQSQKYSEALSLFQDLDGNYNLNPRFRAYYALCLYQTDHLKESAALFDEVLPQLSALSPQERAVYVFAAAESHFAIGHYTQAFDYYGQHLPLCRNNERGDAYFKMAFCSLQTENYVAAYDLLQQAISYYEAYNPSPSLEARKHQIATMLIGAEAQIKRLINKKQ